MSTEFLGWNELKVPRNGVRSTPYEVAHKMGGNGEARMVVA